LASLLLKPWKGSGTVEGILRSEGVHFLGWDRMEEMRGSEGEQHVGFGVINGHNFDVCCLTVVGLVRVPFP
jgi:hypothetical protein